mmetsp:Transcript_29710/g.51272  ORF Transcript_29710/g.51272 Transcript_29710/m.51272 type:complete len:372 (+) Transcript_29710:1604-2719(+)
MPLSSRSSKSTVDPLAVIDISIPLLLFQFFPARGLPALLGQLLQPLRPERPRRRPLPRLRALHQAAHPLLLRVPRPVQRRLLRLRPLLLAHELLVLLVEPQPLGVREPLEGVRPHTVLPQHRPAHALVLREHGVLHVLRDLAGAGLVLRVPLGRPLGRVLAHLLPVLLLHRQQHVLAHRGVLRVQQRPRVVHHARVVRVAPVLLALHLLPVRRLRLLLADPLPHLLHLQPPARGPLGVLAREPLQRAHARGLRFHAERAQLLLLPAAGADLPPLGGPLLLEPVHVALADGVLLLLPQLQQLQDLPLLGNSLVLFVHLGRLFQELLLMLLLQGIHVHAYSTTASIKKLLTTLIRSCTHSHNLGLFLIHSLYL